MSCHGKTDIFNRKFRQNGALSGELLKLNYALDKYNRTAYQSPYNTRQMSNYLKHANTVGRQRINAEANAYYMKPVRANVTNVADLDSCTGGIVRHNNYPFNSRYR